MRDDTEIVVIHTLVTPCPRNPIELKVAMTVSLLSPHSLLGGKVYDLLPSKVHIGMLMTGFNIINTLGFALILFLEATHSVTWLGLYIFMVLIGFASVLPVSLPFQVYAISSGGVRHTGLIISVFELSAQMTGALLELGLGVLLKDKRVSGGAESNWHVVHGPRDTNK